MGVVGHLPRSSLYVIYGADGIQVLTMPTSRIAASISHKYSWCSNSQWVLVFIVTGKEKEVSRVAVDSW